MSRCLPFQRANREAFVESIKPQKEKEESKIERRKEKKLSKLRKENEQDKRRYKNETDHKVKRPKDEKKHHQPGKSADFNAKYPSKKVDDESENSGVTEEREQPTMSSACYLSNDTQSGNKRKRQGSSANGSQTQRIILRLKLPLRKHKVPDSSLSEQYKHCRSTGPKNPQDKTTLRHAPSGERSCHTSAQTNLELEQLNLKPCLDLPVPPQERTHTKTEKTSFCSNEMRYVKSAYKTLIGNWVPESLTQTLQYDVEDQDWLFGSRKQKDEQESKRQKADIEQPCSRSAASWPQAQYLTIVDVWALPYTVPF